MCLCVQESKRARERTTAKDFVEDISIFYCLALLFLHPPHLSFSLYLSPPPSYTLTYAHPHTLSHTNTTVLSHELIPTNQTVNSKHTSGFILFPFVSFPPDCEFEMHLGRTGGRGGIGWGPNAGGGGDILRVYQSSVCLRCARKTRLSIARLRRYPCVYSTHPTHLHSRTVQYRRDPTPLPLPTDRRAGA